MLSVFVCVLPAAAPSSSDAMHTYLLYTFPCVWTFPFSNGLTWPMWGWDTRCMSQKHTLLQTHCEKSESILLQCACECVCVCFVPAWARLFIFTCLCAHVTKSTGFSSAKTRVLHSLLSKVEGEVKKEKKACTREKEEAYSRHCF